MILIAAACGFASILYPEREFEKDDLSTITVITDQNIKITSGRYTRYGYSFTGTPYEAKFTIDNCVNFVCNRGRLKAIKKNDTLTLAISSGFTHLLNEKDEEIPVYTLTINGSSLFSAADYLQGKKKQKIRWVILLSFFGTLIFLLNYNVKHKKVVWGFFILMAAAVIVLIELKVI